MAYESRYIIKEYKDAFCISGRPHPLDMPGQPEWLVDLAYEFSDGRRPRVEVIRRPYHFDIVSSDNRAKLDLYDGGDVGLCDFYKLQREISLALMNRWMSNACDTGDRRAIKLLDWVVKRTSWAINKRAHGQWKRLLTRVDPTVLAVNRKVFSSTFGYGLPAVLGDERLYKEQYVVQDILNYRAAAMAVKICDWLREPDTAIENLRDWRSFYVPDGYRPYTSLNKTLTNLPGNVPLKALLKLQRVVLPRPIYSRLELIATLSATDGLADNFGVVALANADKIRTAIGRVSRHLREPLSPNRWRDVATAVQFMLDFPGKHNGNIVGLAEKSIRWHRDNRDEVARRAIEGFGDEKELAKPPVELPEVDGIRFLRTVGDLVHEGREMKNCISAYAQRAVDGRCYIFHVEHNGQVASVEVDRWGCVRQAAGPRNTVNSAAKWGQKQLTRWGQTLSKNVRPESQNGVFYLV
jgi:hypothetical protein